MIVYFISIFWGIFIGLAVAIPVGPIGLICIQRTLANNKFSGLISGLGAATADALLAIVAAFSLKFVFSFINNNEIFLRIIGAGLLLFLGISALLSKKNKKELKIKTALGHIEEYLSAIVMTITNPLTVFIFLATFAGITKMVGHSLGISIVFVIGVFIGSCIWWLFLTYLTDRLSHKIKDGHIDNINKSFSVLIIAVGLFMLMSVLIKYIDII